MLRECFYKLLSIEIKIELTNKVISIGNPSKFDWILYGVTQKKSYTLNFLQGKQGSFLQDENKKRLILATLDGFVIKKYFLRF